MGAYRNKMKKKILVTGPLLTASGYGEQSRFALRALRSREDLFDIYVNPTAWGQCGWIHDDSEERAWIDSLAMKTSQYIQATNNQPQYDMSLQITIPNEWKKMAPINIGYTAGIETNKISPHWVQPSNQMDKIIVVSSFAKKGFENGVYTATDQRTGQQIPNFKVNIPIEVVNYPVKQVSPKDIDLQLTTDFNFLTVAQLGPRKNLGNTIQWFLEEFKNDANVGLVCKTHIGGASHIDREFAAANIRNILNNHKDAKCKVYLLHGDMSEEEMAGLYTHSKIKALISLSHGEGYGLPIFEAAYYGLPVITTEWSGPTDFMYCPNKEGKIKPHFARVSFTLQPVQQEAVWNGVLEKDTMWAFPIALSAKEQMREVYKNCDRFRGQAKRLATHIATQFEQSKINQSFVDCVIGKSTLKPQDFNGISFCIPTNGKRPDKTELTIKSIKSQTDKPIEIIICGDIDNFRHIDGVTLVDRKEDAHSRKVASLRNKAAEVAKYDVIVWCDDDIILDKYWLYNTISYSMKNGWDVLGSRILNPDGTRHWDRALIEPHILVDYESPNYLPYLQTSGFMCVRKQVFEKIKWNENRLVYADRDGSGIPEDVQYSIDLKNNNLLISFNASSTVWHNDESYTEFTTNSQTYTLKKEVLQKQFSMQFFLPNCAEYQQTISELTNA
ncbi:MAG: hypothetical protein RIR47_101 [Bacteroidota bacterium]|jgi:GT2 family glycosyltransferase